MSIKCDHCGAEYPAERIKGPFQGACPKCLAAAVVSPSEPAPPPEPPPLKPGDRFRSLEILEILGHGGMGVVYKARQVELDRAVALKILPRRASEDPDFVKRFQREAKVLASLSHPHVVGVFDFGTENGLCYLILEYVEGVNLRQVFREGKLSPEQALKLVPQLCDALEYAHERGVVHRDIKPENILIDRQGALKITDFGIAKMLGANATTGNLTGENIRLGTPHYMAPEQVESPRTVDHRADIYSLGVVFYEMLTGELPIGRFAPPSHKVEIDVRLDEVVLKALEKEREHRYQRAAQVKEDVTRIGTTSGGVISRTSIRRYERLLQVGLAFLWLATFVAFEYSIVAYLLGTPFPLTNGEEVLAHRMDVRGLLVFLCMTSVALGVTICVKRRWDRNDPVPPDRSRLFGWAALGLSLIYALSLWAAIGRLLPFVFLLHGFPLSFYATVFVAALAFLEARRCRMRALQPLPAWAALVLVMMTTPRLWNPELKTLYDVQSENSKQRPNAPDSIRMTYRILFPEDFSFDRSGMTASVAEVLKKRAAECGLSSAELQWTGGSDLIMIIIPDPNMNQVKAFQNTLRIDGSLPVPIGRFENGKPVIGEPEWERHVGPYPFP